MFSTLTAFLEEMPEQVKEHISVKEGILHSKVHGREYQYRRFKTPSLGELHKRLKNVSCCDGKLSLREVLGDVKGWRRDESNAGAMFRVALQFNLLK